MKRAWVLMAALPPTVGHLATIRFAASLGGPPTTGAGQVQDTAHEEVQVNVLVCTLPDEPFADIRPGALQAALDEDLQHRVQVLHHPDPVQQVPHGDDDSAFWDLWTAILTSYGFEPGDLLVASERYGVPLARASDARFIPFDPYRELVDCDATRIRADPIGHFALMAAPFARLLTRRITFFGAESVGKSTLSRSVAAELGAHRLTEWARPYLETVGPDVTVDAMHDIWLGQRALQRSVAGLEPRPFVVCDTDLFSTLGYWEMYDPDSVRKGADGLAADAVAGRSDLYIVCPSNIEFVPDPLRYGGDRRETSDQYWIDLLERFELPYVMLTETDPDARHAEAVRHVLGTFDPDVLAYDRVH